MAKKYKKKDIDNLHDNGYRMIVYKTDEDNQTIFLFGAMNGANCRRFHNIG